MRPPSVWITMQTGVQRFSRGQLPVQDVPLMWEYYLKVFSAAFTARRLETWDIVLSKQGGRPKYRSVR